MQLRSGSTGDKALTTSLLPNLESKNALAGRAGLRDGRSVTPRRPPRGLPHAVPGAELREPGGRLRRGLPPGRRAVGLRHCRRDATRARVRLGGANSERTAHEHPSRPETREQHDAGQSAGDGTTHQQPAARVHVRDEVLMLVVVLVGKLVEWLQLAPGVTDHLQQQLHVRPSLARSAVASSAVRDTGSTTGSTVPCRPITVVVPMWPPQCGHNARLSALVGGSVVSGRSAGWRRGRMRARCRRRVEGPVQTSSARSSSSARGANSSPTWAAQPNAHGTGGRSGVNRFLSSPFRQVGCYPLKIGMSSPRTRRRRVRVSSSRVRACWYSPSCVQVAGEVVGRGEGVGVVVAQDPPAAGEGVLVEGAGLLVLAQRVQVARRGCWPR